jgi:hypothetical protein
MYFNPRTAVMPCQELLRMTAIGSWSFDALNDLENDPTDKSAATDFLNWFNQICVVFLQDMAAMMILHPDRSDSAIVWWMPLLSTPQFLQFEEQMLDFISREENPLDASLEQVLPGVYDRFRGVSSNISSISGKLDGIYKHIETGFEAIRKDQTNFLRESSSILGAALINMGEAIMLGGSPNRHPTSSPGDKSSGRNSLAGEVPAEIAGEPTQPLGCCFAACNVPASGKA